MIIQTHDGKQFDVPEENLEGFLKDYNKSIGFDPATLSPNPNVNPERGANWAGVARSAAQGIPIIGSYADEAEAYVRSLIGNKSYDDYLKNARESYEGAKENIPEYAYPAEIATGILGEGALAFLTGGASLHPLAQGAMGAAYGYGMGEGDATNRAISAGVMGSASAALPVAGKYVVKGGKALAGKTINKIASHEMPALLKALQRDTTMKEVVTDTAGNSNTLRTLINKGKTIEDKVGIADDLVKNTTKYGSLYNTINPDIDNMLVKSTWADQLDNAITDVLDKTPLELQPQKYVVDRLKTNLMLNTSKGIDSGIGKSANDLTTKTLISNVNETIDKLKLAPELAKDVKDRVASEVLARRTANTLVGEPLKEEATGSLIKSLGKDALAYGVGSLTPVGGAAGVIIRNLLPGKSSLTKAGEKITNRVIDKSLKKSVESQAGISKYGMKNLNPNGLTNNYTVKQIANGTVEGMVRNEVKPFEKDTAKQIVKFIDKEAAQEGTKKTALKKIIDVLGPRETVKGVLPSVIKGTKPVLIREAIKESDNLVPYTGKEQYEEEIYQPRQMQLPQSMNRNGLILALGNEGEPDSGPSMYEKILAALLAKNLNVA